MVRLTVVVIIVFLMPGCGNNNFQPNFPSSTPLIVPSVNSDSAFTTGFVTDAYSSLVRKSPVVIEKDFIHRDVIGIDLIDDEVFNIEIVSVEDTVFNDLNPVSHIKYLSIESRIGTKLWLHIDLDQSIIFYQRGVVINSGFPWQEVPEKFYFNYYCISPELKSLTW